MIAFLGTGLLGTGFVKALRKRGEAVQVWNRTAAKAQALEADGAKAFEDPAAAVRGAARVHLTLSDDAAVDEVLEKARPGLGKDVVIVDHSTTSPAGAAARAKRWAERGIAFQHAPVFMGPQNAAESSGLMLASGDKALFDRLEPELSKMTGKLQYLGAEPQRAAAFKLLGNLFLTFLTDGVVETMTLAKALGVPRAELGNLFEWFNPAAMVGGRLKRILKGGFENPSWELSMARKDVRLMLEAAQAGGHPLPVLPAIASLMDQWIAKGHGNDDWSVIAKDAL
jgi:3-hydroxyisobutyrate dehydrogenase